MTGNPSTADRLDAGVRLDHGRALDGNGAAGAFAAALGRDVDTAVITCAGCSDRALFSQARAYLNGPGTTLRCRRCGQVIARLATTPRGTWLSFAGSASWLLAPIS